jgi:hypothetical protein
MLRAGGFAVLLAAAAVPAQSGSYFGLYRGVVVNSTDPMQAGRLLVEVYAVSGQTPVWAMPCVPYGTNLQNGALPPFGTDVWIEYEQGDASRPVWVGWRGGPYPPPGLPPGGLMRTPQPKLRMPAANPRSQ